MFPLKSLFCHILNIKALRDSNRGNIVFLNRQFASTRKKNITKKSKMVLPMFIFSFVECIGNVKFI